MQLEKYSFGVGDRFGHQATAQLRAFEQLLADGVTAVPVWNKSNREHTLIGSEPELTTAAAKAAIAQSGWSHGWHVDADHIGLTTVDRFLPHCDLFTIDVADAIGTPADARQIEAFVDRHSELQGELAIVGIATPLALSRNAVTQIAGKYLNAVREAGKVYRYVAERKGADRVIAEVSMDETDAPQSPPELLVILAALADEQVPVQTIAPKFTGRFNKGVDYVGNLQQFEKEFREDLAVIAHAIYAYRLPANLKLSVHSGSDKFSLYPIINRQLKQTGAGLHVKTAGTNWLEELIGLAESGTDGLAMVKSLYAEALEKSADLTAPYATVIDIDPGRLPSAAQIHGWSGDDFAAALRHDRNDPRYNPHLRQLLHVSFKLAAKRGREYTDLLKQHAETVGRNVTLNLYERHLKPLFV